MLATVSQGNVRVWDISSQNAFHSVPNAGDIQGGKPQNATCWRLGGGEGLEQPLKNGDGAWYIGTFSQAAKALTKWEKSIQADSMGPGWSELQ